MAVLRERFITTPAYASMNQEKIDEETRKRRVKAEKLAKAALEGTGDRIEEQIQAEYGAIVAKYKSRLSFRTAR